MLFNFKRGPQREFNYKPRFFDPEREALAEKIRAHENRELTEAEENELRKERISRSFSACRSEERYNKSNFWQGQMRRTATILALFAAMYWVANRYLPKFLEYLRNGAEETEQRDDIRFLEDERRD